MKFSNIELNNFRQYYKTVNIDLNTTSENNIIVIGGKNGYGKTTFLISIVWCLYGDNISKIDENFKSEIKKEKNYQSYMQKSINWQAAKENVDDFSVSILVTDIELPVLNNLNSKLGSIIITRTFNVQSMDETLSILDPVSKKSVFEDESDKLNFINDYLIPFEAAKFVFFDAEKISEIANLTKTEEGNFLNDALGKILGLDIYNNLIDDIYLYINNLKKGNAPTGLQEQIIDTEKAIELTEITISGEAGLEEKNAELQKKIDTENDKIRLSDSVISQHSKQSNSPFNRDAVLFEIQKLRNKEDELESRFHELSEILPLAILTGELEAVNEQIKVQEKNEIAQGSSNENSEKIEAFIELLFNKPPEPESSSMSLKDKLFYYEKAQKLSSEVFGETNDIQELDVEHDLNSAGKKLITDAINLVNSQSKDLFASTIDDFNGTKIKLSELKKSLNKADAETLDELVIEHVSKKETAEYNIAEYNRNIGENIQLIKRSKKDIIRFQGELKTKMGRVDINAQNKLKEKEALRFIDVLNTFLDEQKSNHKISIEKSILNDLKVLMHKLNNDKKQFISDVKVTVLGAGRGMLISLLDEDDQEIASESLAKGEQQIYISCLIKALLKESIHNLPIFIDTPLGRLDEEHRDKMTKDYYPNLSEQVILLSTNSEITPKRFKDLSTSVSKSYLLDHDGANTTLKTGYFNTKSND